MQIFVNAEWTLAHVRLDANTVHACLEERLAENSELKSEILVIQQTDIVEKLEDPKHARLADKIQQMEPPVVMVWPEARQPEVVPPHAPPFPGFPQGRPAYWWLTSSTQPSK